MYVGNWHSMVKLSMQWINWREYMYLAFSFTVFGSAKLISVSCLHMTAVNPILVQAKQWGSSAIKGRIWDVRCTIRLVGSDHCNVNVLHFGKLVCPIVPIPIAHCWHSNAGRERIPHEITLQNEFQYCGFKMGNTLSTVKTWCMGICCIYVPCKTGRRTMYPELSSRTESSTALHMCAVCS